MSNSSRVGVHVMRDIVEEGDATEFTLDGTRHRVTVQDGFTTLNRLVAAVNEAEAQGEFDLPEDAPAPTLEAAINEVCATPESIARATIGFSILRAAVEQFGGALMVSGAKRTRAVVVPEGMELIGWAMADKFTAALERQAAEAGDTTITAAVGTENE